MQENSNDPIGSINISSGNNTSDSDRDPDVTIAQASSAESPTEEIQSIQEYPEDSPPKGPAHRKLPSRSSAP